MLGTLCPLLLFDIRFGGNTFQRADYSTTYYILKQQLHAVGHTVLQYCTTNVCMIFTTGMILLSS
jgi:hypothetical protein